MNFAQMCFELLQAFIDLGGTIKDFLTAPLLPPSVLSLLDSLPDGWFAAFGLTDPSEITMIWALGAGFVVFAVITVVKWIIGIVT